MTQEKECKCQQKGQICQCQKSNEEAECTCKHHHDHEGCCGGHGHQHDHEGCCGGHGHHHDHEGGCGGHGHQHDHEGCCGGHGHQHDHEGCCGGHGYQHDHEGCCGGHGHQHDHEGCCGGHGHHHDHEGCCCGHNHEHFNDIEPDAGVTVQFSGLFEAPIAEVWAMLTENERLKQWFPELEFEAVEPGGRLIFNYRDGGSEEMMVLDVEKPHYLSFTWDINIVSFELQSAEEGQTEMVFTEWISQVNDHSPVDLTGWMICLQNMAAVLNNEPFGDREEKFDELYPRIKTMLEQQTDQEFD
ncbi:SRPBCC domain-containing protein [Vaginisenegalia massiliensis]|uniref:SRPBCC domain-containing protein n=1 Tax=Vaginisenegalia massiliensis TaxID=2058294 RepID=UPI000F52473D|nr:SRPBCC domain-containing protein [Vaginisenegalia massiliensis]